MNIDPSTRRSLKPSEQGYILVGVIFMLAILVIALTAAAPKIAKSIQRDRELETMHRGKQYARAVKLYYKQFNAYPPNLDALTKTNEIRFLRRKYIDPTTGKDEWKVIHVGQNKAPTAFGFFGVPLNGAGIGAGLCGNAGPTSTTSGASGGSLSSGSSGFSSGSSGSSFGSSTPMTGCAPSDTSTTGSATSTGGTGTADQSATNSSTDQSGANGNSTPGTGNSGTGNSNTPTAIGSGTGTNSGTGLTGQTFGGGIMGFSPNSPKQSILVYKKKNHFNEWEFVYDPIADQMMMQGGNMGAIGTPAGSIPGSSPIGSGSTFGPGSGPSGSSIGSPGGTNPGGPTPTPGPPSTTPQPPQ